MYTRRGLRDKLEDRGYATAVAEEGVVYLEELRLLDDVEYARAFARMKWRTSRWAPTRVRMALQQKSVATADIDKGLHAAAAEYQDQDDLDGEGRHEGS
jgi:SOS response regulatory protein OraA/RecX